MTGFATKSVRDRAWHIRLEHLAKHGTVPPSFRMHPDTLRQLESENKPSAARPFSLLKAWPIAELRLFGIPVEPDASVVFLDVEPARPETPE